MKKHIVCLGDSNTHGYCANPADCADGGSRYNEDERWTCLLQKALGSKYLVLEEGLGGRTTVFPDPLHESMDAVSVAYPILMSHEPVDLLIIMLGTNDAKDRFCVTPEEIGIGMQRLVREAKSTECWGGKSPNIFFADCNFTKAVDGVQLGILFNQGEVCAAVLLDLLHLLVGRYLAHEVVGVLLGQRLLRQRAQLAVHAQLGRHVRACCGKGFEAEYGSARK